MKRISLLVASFVAASWFAFGVGAAVAAPAIVVTEPPPPPRVETIPAPVAGRAWVEGHWVWRDGDYVWRPGHWVTARRDMVWVQGHWVERDGEWTYVEGHWRRGRGNAYGWRNRDDDGDGIANYEDRFPRDSSRS